VKAFTWAAAFLALGGALPAVAQDSPLYRDRTRPVDERVRDLLSRMTLEEKVAQTLGIWKGKEKITDAAGQFDPAGARALIPNGLGQLSRPTELRDKPTKILLGPREDAVFVNAVQKWLIENTRLGIPVMTHEEALHGLVAPKGTNFPIPIALASTWDPALVERVMSIAALEARPRPGARRGRDPRRTSPPCGPSAGRARGRGRARALRASRVPAPRAPRYS
jgi:beta-glucosidase